MTTSRMRMIVAAVSLCVAHVCVFAQDAPLYSREATWGDTMAAVGARYRAWQATRTIEAGPWHATAPIPAASFPDALFPEQGVDLEAKDANGNPLWTPRPEWADGQVVNLPGRDRASTYLFRTLTVPSAMSVVAGLGSDDGAELWLNGEKLLSKDVPRGPAPNQDLVTLDLQPGENRILFKIHNQTGGHGFYFALSSGPLMDVWVGISSDFPNEARAVDRDLPGGAIFDWFRDAARADLLAGMAEKTLGELETLRGTFEPLLKDLEPGTAPWFNQYAVVARARDVLAEVAHVDVEALRLAIEDLSVTFPASYVQGADYAGRLAGLQAELAAALDALMKGDAPDAEALASAGSRMSALQREALMANPLLDFDTLLLIKRGAGTLGLPQNWQGNCSVPRAPYDNEIAALAIADPGAELRTVFRPQEGDWFVGDVDLHFDGNRMLFTMPGGQHGRWHIWEMNVDGSGLRQVTPDTYADVNYYDACYLPDGRILFDSTGCFQGIPCVGGSDSVANLHLMNADGSGVRQLCFDQDHNWCPTVLNNGRVLFSRWEYSDTPHYFSRLLFHMNPDGTGQMEYYGSNSFWPNSIFYARPIPNHPTKVVAIVSGHHGVPRMGELILFDPAKGRHEGDGAVQRIPGRGKKVDPIIVDQLVNDSWPRFLHPFPLSDKYFLVSCQPSPDAVWGIYLVDVFDNMLLIKEVPGYALFEPLPLRKTTPPPAVPDKVDLKRDDAVVYLTDVYTGQGLDGVPRGTVKKLRLYEFHYAYPKMGGHVHIGVEGPWDVHRILGTVPVFEDGSAVFRVPANMPIAVQPLDEEGKALQTMRSWFAAMPGETLSCVGCHERQNSVPPPRQTIAARTAPCDIEPWYGPARGFSFKRDVQPVLDKYCVGCHNGQERPDGKKIRDFARKEQNGWGNFTPSYLELHPFVRRPGPESDYRVPVALEWHADTSPLVQMLTKNHQGVDLDQEAWDRLITWIDLNVPDHGTWGEQSAIPANFHQRRMEMRTQYANRPEDPEVIPALDTAPPAFVAPSRPHTEPGEATAEGWPFSAEEARQQQEAAANPRMTVDLGDGVTMDLVLIPNGQFVMGNAQGPDDTRPVCAAAIDKPFWMAVTEVTCTQYRQFNPSHFNGFFDQHNKDHTMPGYPADGPNMPAIRVSWEEALAYCDWLSAKTGMPFTLPTEAQWEWACRAGSATPLYYGDLDTDFAPQANLADASIKLLAVAGINPQPIENPSPYEDFLPKEPRFDDGHRLMCDVANYATNPWGLHDMHGNVWEWTLSAYRPYPYVEDDGRNDRETAGKRVARGGSWFDRPKVATSAARMPYRSYQRVYNVGFRVICAAGDPAPVTVARSGE